MGFALLTLAALSYIGLGIEPPDSEWGEMTSEGATLIDRTMVAVPVSGAGDIVTVLNFNLVGDGLRDLLDPRMRGIRDLGRSRNSACISPWTAARCKSSTR